MNPTLTLLHKKETTSIETRIKPLQKNKDTKEKKRKKSSK
jgi:hypothetical protein